MIEQISALVQQFAGNAIVNNTAIPNEKNDAVISETGSSILSSLQGLASNSSNFGGIAEILSGKSSISLSNPIVKQLVSMVASNLTQKTGISSDAASNVSTSIIPSVLTGLLGKANNSSDSSIDIMGMVQALTGGNSSNSNGLMSMIASAGGKAILDQNGDGKVDMQDAVSAVSGGGKSGIGGMLGKLFGK
ncbi:MAG: hypothetical protein ACK5IJ_00050 [Mangrovibacterium sp.]